jgi:hypothetical protein
VLATVVARDYVGVHELSLVPRPVQNSAC